MTKRSQAVIVAATLMACAPPAFAHVKWFVETSFASRPLSLTEAVTPTFLALVVLSMVTIGAFVFAESRLGDRAWYVGIIKWLEARQQHSDVVMRVAAFAVLLMNWQADAMLVPEFGFQNPWIGWLQFGLALLLLFPRTTPLTGTGMVLLYLYAVSRFGAFHMLDYMHYPGVGLFLALSQSSSRIRALQIPVLYASVGFSLCWLGLEKIVYPQWGLVLLEEHPELALGFPIEFFLTGAAFVEISLGFLLILGVLERPLAATITIVFFLTTMVFGKTEVIGHTLVHGALLVFLLRGTGEMYRPPIAIHRSLSMRISFGAVNFLVTVAVLLTIYTSVAGSLYATTARASVHRHGRLDVSAEASIPRLDVELIDDVDLGWNAHLRLENFRFAPERAGQAHAMGEGHVHLQVNGAKVARWYGPWGHVPALPPGEHTLRITLNTNDHREYTIGDDPIAWETTLVVDPS